MTVKDALFAFICTKHMRNNKLDFFKGFLMFSVVFGHTINALLYNTGGHIALHTLLRTFDMPMFMLISGFLLRGSLQRHSEWHTIANRATGIALPAIIWIAITFAIGHKNTYYFLWAVFGSSTIIALTHKLFNNEAVRIAFVVLCIAVLHTIDYRCMNMAYLLPFFAIGYYTKSLQLTKWQGLISIMLFAAAFYFWKTEYTFWNAGANLLKNTAQMTAIVCFRFVIGILGIASAIFLLDRTYDKFSNNWFFSTIEKFGKETLGLYLTQYVAVEVGIASFMQVITNKFNSNPLANYQTMTGYIIAPLIAFGILFLLYLIVSMLKEKKATKWLFGVKAY